MSESTTYNAEYEAVLAEIAAEWPELPDPLPTDPYDEDGYCDYCGNGRWKLHAPWCKWQDAIDAGRPNPPGPRVHNHPPYRPVCNEREVDGQLRGACLSDAGSDR